MKNIFISFILFIPFALSAQTSGTCQGTIKLAFIYDAAGNRIQRKLVCDNNSSTVRAGTPYTEELEVYPNPSSGLFTAKVPQTYSVGASLTAYDSKGVKVLEMNTTSLRQQVDLQSHTNGIYIIHISNKEGTLREATTVIKK